MLAARSLASLGAAPRRPCRQQRALHRVAASAVRKVNAEELEVTVAGRTKPIVVDFYASWCGPCVLLAAELVKVAEEFGERIEILKVDTDAETQLASQLQIQGLPTLVFIPAATDKPALRTEGLMSAADITRIINDELLAAA